MTQNMNRVFQAAQHNPFDMEETGRLTRAILESLPAPARHPALFGAMCYTAGIAEGKHLERQRLHARQQGERFTGSGDFLFTVQGDGAAPAFIDGDVVTIRAAACTPDLQTARAVVIRQGPRWLIGRLNMHRDGSAEILHGGQPISFDPERDFIGPVVAMWRSLEPTAAATE